MDLRNMKNENNKMKINQLKFLSSV